MTPKSVHREKGGGRVTRKGEEDHRRGIIPLTARRRKDEGGSTEMQQDQIRAFRLFILVNTTPRIASEILDFNTIQEFLNTMGSSHHQCNSGLYQSEYIPAISSG